jgi:hypothetical protein
LTIGTFHILDNASVLSRLKSELEEAMPDARSILPLLELEKLPYLSAVSKEGKPTNHSMIHLHVS